MPRLSVGDEVTDLAWPLWLEMHIWLRSCHISLKSHLEVGTAHPVAGGGSQVSIREMLSVSCTKRAREPAQEARPQKGAKAHGARMHGC